MPIFDPKVFLDPDDIAELPSRDPEIRANARRVKHEEESEILDVLLEAYPRATGSRLEVEDGGESPDFICARPDGTLVGVEITTVRRGHPDRVLWDSILNYTDEMAPDETLGEIERLIAKKGDLRRQYRIKRNILVIAINESDFDVTVRLAASVIEIEDLRASGFTEIWLVDRKAIRDGAHREARLFGLYPKRYRQVTGRSMWDQKPHG